MCGDFICRTAQPLLSLRWPDHAEQGLEGVLPVGSCLQLWLRETETILRSRGLAQGNTSSLSQPSQPVAYWG